MRNTDLKISKYVPNYLHNARRVRIKETALDVLLLLSAEKMSLRKKAPEHLTRRMYVE